MGRAGDIPTCIWGCSGLARIHGCVKKTTHDLPDFFLRGLSAGLLFFYPFFVARVPIGRMSDRTILMALFCFLESGPNTLVVILSDMGQP